MNLGEIHIRAARAIGQPIEWSADGASGLLRCPAEQLHTAQSGSKDCKIYIEGAPTIYCFHTSCAAGVATANLKLRRALGGSDWSVTMPDGSVLRSGEARAPVGSPAPVCDPNENKERKARRAWLESISAHIKAGRGADILQRYQWTPEQMVADSPIDISDGESFEHDFVLFMALWHPDDIVWCGAVRDTGQPHHMTRNFRRASEWAKLGRMAEGFQFTCGSAFDVGTYSRSNENVIRQRFMVVESDTLNREEVGAVFRFLRVKLRHTLFAIVDTGGKSLHGWFNVQPNKLFHEELKATLIGLGCDPALFKASQPVRLCGVPRDGEKNQVLLWCRDDGREGTR